MNALWLNISLGLFFVALCASIPDEAAAENVISEPQIREKRTVARSRVGQGPSMSQLSDVLSRFSTDGSFLGSDLSMYTPPTPPPEDVNCYVEVPTTTMVGGRCVNMGSESFVCQAGAYLGFTTDCQTASASRYRRANGNAPRGGSAFQNMLNRRANRGN
ncbi:hypothetical protein RRG08_044625 [Elysia crispata]|uniref:Uncharacterized protein n=1 Tax=Elysia crispata TaxID=231223 RepID=A0AAE0YM18_9GAST|nr:hypothetical protein RRG08_044625 [Elysia crispata]